MTARNGFTHHRVGGILVGLDLVERIQDESELHCGVAPRSSTCSMQGKVTPPPENSFRARKFMRVKELKSTGLYQTGFPRPPCPKDRFSFLMINKDSLKY
jgi:hypothetical protein